MKSRKNGFLAFIFSLLPGAGEMYMGLFKQGISLMGAFFGVIGIAVFFGLNTLLFLIPLIWFYSFFHVHHLRSLPPEDFYAVEDRFLFGGDWNMDFRSFIQKHTKAVAIALVLTGIVLLWKSILDEVRWILPDWAYSFLFSVNTLVPRLVVGILILAVGIKMLRGTTPKKPAAFDEEEEEYKEEV